MAHVNVSDGADAYVSLPWLMFAFWWATYFIWLVSFSDCSEHAEQQYLVDDYPLAVTALHFPSDALFDT